MGDMTSNIARMTRRQAEDRIADDWNRTISTRMTNRQLEEHWYDTYGTRIVIVGGNTKEGRQLAKAGR